MARWMVETIFRVFCSGPSYHSLLETEPRVSPSLSYVTLLPQRGNAQWHFRRGAGADARERYCGVVPHDLDVP